MERGQRMRKALLGKGPLYAFPFSARAIISMHSLTSLYWAFPCYSQANFFLAWGETSRSIFRFPRGWTASCREAGSRPSEASQKRRTARRAPPEAVLDRQPPGHVLLHATRGFFLQRLLPAGTTAGNVTYHCPPRRSALPRAEGLPVRVAEPAKEAPWVSPAAGARRRQAAQELTVQPPLGSMTCVEPAA